MHKLYIFLSIIMLVSFLTSCSGNAAAQAVAITPTNLPATVESTTFPPTSLPTTMEPTAIPEVVSREPPATCPVTVPQNPPFTPPAPYDALGTKGYFWYGSSSLWTELPDDAVWYSLPLDSEGYTQKEVWWRDGYVWDQEPEPKLIVTGERLDAKAPPLYTSTANGVYASDIGSAMMVGVDFPTLGCWKITGKYQVAELSFVIWVAP